MSYFNYTNLEVPTEVFTYYAPYNSQSLFSPPTVQHNEVYYQHDNSFGFLDQGYEPENSYQYFDNGYQHTEEENQVIFYPVINQVYIPESQIYNVVHAVEYQGTTYFYQSLVDIPIYRFYNTTSYTPVYNVDGHSSYSSSGYVYNDNVDEYVENPAEYDPLPSSVELLPTENHVSLSPSINMSSLYSPDLDTDSSSYNSYWNAIYNQSQSDIVENYNTNTISDIIQGNVMQSTDQNRYSENTVIRKETTVYYEQVSHEWPQIRNDLSIGEKSIQELIQVPILPLEALEKNAIKAQVKYRKDSIYLTALSGKLSQKQSIPVVDRMPVITEVVEEYPTLDSSNNIMESQDKSVVQANTIATYSKKLSCRKSIRVDECLTEIKNFDHKDNGVDLSSEKLSKTTQQLDLSVQGNMLTKQCRKRYKKESFVFVQKTHLKEVYDKDKVTESSKSLLSKMEQTYSVVEGKIFTKRSEKIIRKERKQDFGIMPAIQEADDEDKVQSNNVNIPKIRRSVVQSNTLTERSRKFYGNEKCQAFAKMHTIEEVDEEGQFAEPNIENFLKIKESVVCTNMFSERGKKVYKKKSFPVLHKMPSIKEEEHGDYEGESNQNAQTNAFVMRSKKHHVKENIRRFKRRPLIKENGELFETPESEETGNKYSLKPYETKEMDNDTVKDHDGSLGYKGYIEENILSQENGFQSKNIDIPQLENKKTDDLLHSIGVRKSPVMHGERYSSDKCQEIQQNHNIWQEIELNSPVKIRAESMSLIPLSEEELRKESLEAITTFEKEKETTKERSQKSKKKRFQNVRKFFTRLLCCGRKGPT